MVEGVAEGEKYSLAVEHPIVVRIIRESLLNAGDSAGYVALSDGCDGDGHCRADFPLMPRLR